MTCSLIILFTIFCPVIELDVIVNYILIITVRSILSKLDCFSHTGLQWLPKHWHWPHQAHCCSRPRSCDNLHIRRLDCHSIQGTVYLVSQILLFEKDLGRLPYWIWSTRCQIIVFINLYKLLPKCSHFLYFFTETKLFLNNKVNIAFLGTIPLAIK